MWEILLVESGILHFRIQGNCMTVISYDWNDKETNPVVDPESKDCNPQYKIVLGYNMGKTTNWLDKLHFIADMHHVFVP